jgi:hypothetical protein
MSVQIDQARHHHEVGAVDRFFRRSVVALADVGQRVAGEGDVAAHKIRMAPVRRVPGDDTGDVANAGRRWHGDLRAMASA